MGSKENVSRPRKEYQKKMQFGLPPGFRFHPTDEELINHYLTKKVSDNCFCSIAIAEVDLNKCEPWDLPGLAKMGETEWYYFCVRDRKYPSGLRTNRATEAGYWKATGKDKEIIMTNALIGMKKTLVFYKGRAPKGEKTNWVMHEYRMEGKHSQYNQPRPGKSEWVICRVFEKSPHGRKVHIPRFGRLFNSYDEEEPSSATSVLPPLMDSSSPYNNSETRTTTAGELSHQNTQDDNIVDSIQTPTFDFPPSQHLYSPFAPQIGNSQSLLRVSMESQKAEFSEGSDFDNDMFHRLLGNQEQHPLASAGPVDIDCLWNY